MLNKALDPFGLVTCIDNCKCCWQVNILKNSVSCSAPMYRKKCCVPCNHRWFWMWYAVAGSSRPQAVASLHMFLMLSSLLAPRVLHATSGKTRMGMEIHQLLAQRKHQELDKLKQGQEYDSIWASGTFPCMVSSCHPACYLQCTCRVFGC